MMRCITPIALYIKMDAECDKQVTVASQLLTTLGVYAVAALDPSCCTQRWTVGEIYQQTSSINS